MKKYLSLFQVCGFSGGSDSKGSACNMGDLGSIPGLGRSPREGMVPTPVFFPGELHGQRSLAGYSLWDHKESDTTDFHTHILCMRKPPEDFKPRNGIKHILLKDHND